MTPEEQRAEWLTMIEDCAVRVRKLVPWEAGFIESIRDYLTKFPGAKLTPGQIDKLDGIWERVTS